MPPTIRDRLRRDLAKVYVHAERSLQSIMLLDEAFKTDHQEYSAGLEVMADALLTLQEMVRMFWISAWGKCPDDIMDWWDHHGTTNTDTQ
jgi:hypothetical protein